MFKEFVWVLNLRKTKQFVQNIVQFNNFDEKSSNFFKGHFLEIFFHEGNLKIPIVSGKFNSYYISKY